MLECGAGGFGEEEEVEEPANTHTMSGDEG